MTNYDSFPYWRTQTGIVIKFDDLSYSWADDNSSNRKYLFESDYLSNASNIFICKYKTWISKEEFKVYCVNIEFQEKLKLSFIEKENKLGLCPLCNSKLKICVGNNGDFVGCNGFSKCKYLKNL